VAEAERIAREKAEADRLAAARQEAERLAQETAAREAAEKARILKAKADADRIAREKAEADRLAAVKAEEERRAREQAAAEQLAAQKAAEERRAAEKAAIAAAEQNERELAAARKAEEAKLAADRLRQERLGLKEKAIAEYKGILERFPNTPAARTAATRLKELGVAVVVPPAAAPAQPVESTATAQVLTLEVAQYAAFEFEVQPPQTPVEVARKNMIRLRSEPRQGQTVSILLQLPAEFGGVLLLQQHRNSRSIRPAVGTREKFKGLLLLSVLQPQLMVSGLPIRKGGLPVYAGGVQSRTVSLTAAAPCCVPWSRPTNRSCCPVRQCSTGLRC